MVRRNTARPIDHEPAVWSARIPEQTAIAEGLSDMDALLAALEQRRDKTRALKQEQEPARPKAGRV